MKKHVFISYAAALALTGLPAMADHTRPHTQAEQQSISDGYQKGDVSVQDPKSIDQQAGTVATEETDKKMAEEKVQEKGGMKMEGEKKDSAKMKLAPHTVMITSSLKGALEAVKGLKTELKVSEDLTPSGEYIEHFKMFGNEINSDLGMAKEHQSHLKASVGSFPEIARSDEYKNVNSAFSELSSLNSSWQAKIKSSEYWKNPKVAMTDLEQLEKRLNQAIDNAKSLNSELDIRYVG